jgi:serine/threonine protein phosphatase PrpC
VSAVVTETAVTVGWIGDSRAYWLSPDGSERLTIDDSVVGQLAAGRAVPPGAAVDPTSRALIRWLGADSDDGEPQVVSMSPDSSGLVLLCSDGLSHYLSEPDDLAAAASVSAAAMPSAAMPHTPLAVARTLTRLALDAGGHDNVAVAVLPFPPLANSPEGSLP